MPGLWYWTEQEIKDLRAQLNRIEGKVNQLLIGQAKGKELIMSEQEEIANLVEQVQANRDVVQSATTALEGLTQTVADLTQELQDAIAASTDVSPEIKAAADALKVNTVALNAAIPQLAQAVAKNTKAA
jgi:DNA repair exonuclease SbcCD ATPase subunit